MGIPLTGVAPTYGDVQINKSLIDVGLNHSKPLTEKPLKAL
jgi:hypothetical protein